MFGEFSDRSYFNPSLASFHVPPSAPSTRFSQVHPQADPFIIIRNMPRGGSNSFLTRRVSDRVEVVLSQLYPQGSSNGICLYFAANLIQTGLPQLLQPTRSDAESKGRYAAAWIGDVTAHRSRFSLTLGSSISANFAMDAVST